MLRSKQSGRCSRKTLLIMGGLTGGLILLIVILAVTLTPSEQAPPPSESTEQRNGFELDDYLNGRFGYKRFNGTWVSDTQFMYRDKDGNVLLRDMFASTSQTLLTTTDTPLLSESFLQHLSADRKFLLLGYAYEKLFRHTYLANYSVINLDTKVETQLVAPDGTQRLQLVKWAPVENALVLVHDNNMYYKATADSTEMHSLTSDGQVNRIYNGVPDWVYEEEVLGSNEALWFSSDGKKLAYMSFDDTGVHSMTWPWYGEASNFAFQYPLTVSIKYPKPGTPNPIVKLSLIDLVKATEGNAVSIPLKPPSQVGAVTEVSAVWMNRVQNMFVITANSAENGSPTQVMETSQTGGWVEMFSPPKYSNDGQRFITILPQPQGADGDYRHLTLITRQAGNTPIITALTSGKFVVTSIAAWDLANNVIYYLATTEADPAQQHLYRIKDDGSETSGTCLSCGVKDGTKRELWEENVELAAFWAAHAVPSRTRQWVDVPGSMKAYVQLWLPPDMDFSGNTKYPMLINVYGGPDSVQVSDRWTGDWGTYLTTNRSIIYGAIDGRGSGLKGNNVLFSGFRRLGTVEIEDQINVTKYLQDTLPYIDKNRTSIWGWSYGGYSTGMALSKDLNGVFRCGMSVAPVTDWIYYDSIYTERYMGLPEPSDNLQGYSAANLNNFVDNLGRNLDRYLLVHGTADDNVHYQQSMILSRTLELKDILFRQQSYPDEAHGLNGVSPHLYKTLENFLDECMDLPRSKWIK
ncbi:hypothetical protein B566_EDAN002451 [Ephemera danica]|nr:hypothetical protein B566_EDAN002451 [Ephemera danica]